MSDSYSQTHVTPQTSAALSTLIGRRSLPRVFTVRWDNSKTRTRDTRKHEKQEAFGVVFPNGLVSLDNGSTFSMMAELHHMLDLRGTYEISYLDEQEQAG